MNAAVSRLICHQHLTELYLWVFVVEDHWPLRHREHETRLSYLVSVVGRLTSTQGFTQVALEKFKKSLLIVFDAGNCSVAFAGSDAADDVLLRRNSSLTVQRYFRFRYNIWVFSSDDDKLLVLARMRESIYIIMSFSLSAWLLWYAWKYWDSWPSAYGRRHEYIWSRFCCAITKSGIVQRSRIKVSNP